MDSVPADLISRLEVTKAVTPDMDANAIGVLTGELNVPALVLSGAGVAPRKALGHVRNVDVAPTIATLLGVDLPQATGRVLAEAYADERR